MHSAGFKTAAFFLFVFILFAACAVEAIQVGKTVEYKGGNMGRVIFSGTAHNEAGLHCMKCHNTFFIPKIGAARITYADHAPRKAYCFGCHNGTNAFDVMTSCNRCHKKGPPSQ